MRRLLQLPALLLSRVLGYPALLVYGVGKLARRGVGAARRLPGVRQVPLGRGKGKPASIVHEVDLLRALQRGDVSMDAPASSVAAAVGGLVYPKARVEELYAIFAKDQVAIVVDGARIVGIVSQIDLIDYLSRKTGS